MYNRSVHIRMNVSVPAHFEIETFGDLHSISALDGHYNTLYDPVKLDSQGGFAHPLLSSIG